MSLRRVGLAILRYRWPAPQTTTQTHYPKMRVPRHSPRQFRQRLPVGDGTRGTTLGSYSSPRGIALAKDRMHLVRPLQSRPTTRRAYYQEDSAKRSLNSPSPSGLWDRPGARIANTAEVLILRRSSFGSRHSSKLGSRRQQLYNDQSTISQAFDRRRLSRSDKSSRPPSSG
jgi:hypothetical protein